MTVTPKKSSPQPASSSYSTSARSDPVQMDDADGLRLKPLPLSEDGQSLTSSFAEPINLEDSHYARLRSELEFDAQNLEAESWSVAVDQNYLKALNKEAVNRQDVIYELMQTEMHHVRTLKILLYVYMHELRQSHLIDEARLEWLFPGVDSLLSFHQHFLNCLKARQSQSLEEGDANSYQITQLGDILISQFSDQLGDGMMECYSIFCSHQKEAISFYKEQLQNNKKLQILIRKLGQLPLVRRLGIPECFLLVTQRITKYPVLVERIIQNSEADTEECKSLVQGLVRIKDTIFQVDAQVSEYEKAARLRDIILRLDTKSQGRLKNGRVFRRDDLIQGDRTLLHEGTITWKTSGRQKEILAVLLSDVLLLLQEKDQKFLFAAVENKPSIISLHGLIIREVAHEDKAMFLISACNSSVPEMYEIHTGSRDERITWMTLIREAVEHYPQEEQHRELIAKLQHCQDALKERDEQITQSLAAKQQIFAALFESVMEQETPHKGLLLRGDATDLQQGEMLLKGAIHEVENLQNLLCARIKDPNPPVDETKMQGGLLRRAETFAAGDGDSYADIMNSGDVAERPGSAEGSAVYVNRSSSTPQLQEILYSEGLEQSVRETRADDDTLPEPDLNSASSHFPGAEVCDRVISLAQMLHSLQAIIAQQTSQLELQRVFQSNSQQPSRHYSNVLLEREKQRSLEKQREELANLHKLQTQHREEQQRWEKDRERQRIQIEALEDQLQQREEECSKWEEKLSGEKGELERQWENYQQDLERLRESTQSVEKERERLTQERERLEQFQEKLKSKLTQLPYSGHYDDPAQGLYSYPSFRSILNGSGRVTLTPKPSILLASSPMEVPPKVPPRKGSINPQAAKSELPIHLISTTNQVLKPPVVQQQIPTKLATLSKGKDKGSKSKGSHQRTHSAASIDVNQVLPIRVTGKEGGSMRAMRTASPQRIYQSDTFKPPGSGHNVKTSQSFSTQKKSSSDGPPPAPPPFPKEVLEAGKEKVIFL
nr:PREDICTED: rho guanine nucleotide exchange factor 18-like isoform X1 [Paralichthys olivaceus]XP_019968031.1 PREDICTED: rho guanine nucleotide exchange factor 18-like isoform X1 [Paralichthys olivaceus]XP_019968038.1 PREDICTED: rho guanine nucleotide exchange factor 18-like isoform X1 [Paralichthys olivaceus]XP_019968046.1 PREDICTED: rho guanine nucleotide exchange factor 18-like isoform X1 [Paralichthys olivaceus]